MSYPKDYIENLRYRANVLQKAENDIELQRALIDQCSRDRLYFFNVFAYTYNPRTEDKHLPFITYDYQDKAIMWDAQAAEDQVDTLVEKSRDMGVSWIFIVNDFHDWLFKKEKIEIKWGSRKEVYVDEGGNMDSIFEKFRYLYKHIPKWMLPKGFNPNKHDNSMRLINPETGSALTGESTNDDFSRGGRKYRVRFDEFAFWDCAENAWKASADATNCRTALSTPNGASNKFAELAKDPNIRKIKLHWTLHPIKRVGAYLVKDHQTLPIDMSRDPEMAYNYWIESCGELSPEPMIGSVVRSTWYDAECNRRNAKEVAQELDIDYLSSGSPFFDLRALQKQKPWGYIYRERPTDPIPHGSYIRARIKESDHKHNYIEDRNGWLKIYEEPTPTGQYIVGGDTAEGLPKGDESVCVVRNKYTGDVCAVFNGAYSPDDHAFKLFQTAKLYNNAKIAPENNNHGYSVCSDLKQMDCDLYWTRKENEKTKEVTLVKAGWSTTPQSRPMMLDQMEEEISKGSFELRDATLIAQCTTFINNDKGKAEAEGNFHDDLVIACAIAGQVIKEFPYKKPKDKKKRRPQMQKSNAGFGF